MMSTGGNALAAGQSFLFRQDSVRNFSGRAFTMREYWPWGSGFGTFVPGVRRNENLDLANANRQSRAHDQCSNSSPSRYRGRNLAGTSGDGDPLSGRKPFIGKRPDQGNAAILGWAAVHPGRLGLHAWSISAAHGGNRRNCRCGSGLIFGEHPAEPGKKPIDFEPAALGPRRRRGWRADHRRPSLGAISLTSGSARKQRFGEHRSASPQRSWLALAQKPN